MDADRRRCVTAIGTRSNIPIWNLADFDRKSYRPHYDRPDRYSFRDRDAPELLSAASTSDKYGPALRLTSQARVGHRPLPADPYGFRHTPLRLAWVRQSAPFFEAPWLILPMGLLFPPMEMA